jgi:hypothetical protein
MKKLFKSELSILFVGTLLSLIPSAAFSQGDKVPIILGCSSGCGDDTTMYLIKVNNPEDGKLIGEKKVYR